MAFGPPQGPKHHGTLVNQECFHFRLPLWDLVDSVGLGLGALCGLFVVQKPLAVLAARQHADLSDG